MSMSYISQPASGEKQAVTLAAGQMIGIAFDTASANVERAENDLLFRFDDGSEIRVDDFFVTGGNALPKFVFEDGTEVAGAQLLSRLNNSMDISPAAGPAAGERSGGAGEYASDAGELVGGVERLGALDALDGYAVPQTEAVEFVATGIAAANDAPSIDIPVIDVPEPKGYHTRFVVTGETSNITFQAVDAAGNLITDPSLIKLLNVSELSYFDSCTINPDGSITMQLSQAGRDALQNGTKVNDTLVISVADVEYQMPLLIQDDQKYNSADEEARAGLDTNLDAEWYISSGVMNGVTIRLGGSEHNLVSIDSLNADSFSVSRESRIEISGDSSDTIHISNSLSSTGRYRASIDTGGGDDSLVAGYVSSSGQGSTTLINTGSGNDSVSAEDLSSWESTTTLDTGTGDDNVYLGDVNAYKSTTTIATGDGNDTIKIGPDDGVQISSAQNSDVVSTLVIDAGNGDDKLSMGLLWVNNKGASDINMGAGDDTVDVWLRAHGNAENNIDTGEGNDRLTLERTTLADDAANTIVTGNGNDTVIGDILETGYTNSYNTIDTGAGDDTVSFNTVKSQDYNTIDTGSGNDTITISGSIDTSYDGHNEIYAGSGDDAIIIDGDITASSVREGLTTLFDAGEGNDSIRIATGRIDATGLLIDGGEGDGDTLYLLGEDPSTDNSMFVDLLKNDAAIERIESLVLDLSESRGTLDMDALLASGGLDAGTKLYVKNIGDDDELLQTLSEQPGWEQGAVTVADDGTSYNTYTHAENELTIYLQTSTL